MNTNEKFLLWIDDDHQLLDHAVSRLRENGINVLIEPDADRALEIIRDQHDQISGVLLDLMLDPGSELSKLDTQGGFETGFRMIDHLQKNDLLEDLNIRIFTNASSGQAFYSPANGDNKIPIDRKSRYKGIRFVKFVEDMLESRTAGGVEDA